MAEREISLSSKQAKDLTALTGAKMQSELNLNHYLAAIIAGADIDGAKFLGIQGSKLTVQVPDGEVGPKLVE